MNQGLGIVVLAAGFSACLGHDVTAQDAGGIVVRREHAECIRDNAENYLNQNRNPLFIYPGYCQLGEFNPDPARVAEETALNSSAWATIRLKDGTEIPGDQRATLLILTAAQVRCIQEHFATVAGGGEAVPDMAGTTVEVVRLHFDACE